VEASNWKIGSDSPKGSVIFLHGYGANAHDLKPIAEIWSKKNSNWEYHGINGIIPISYGFSWFSLETNSWHLGLFEAATWLEKYCAKLKGPFVFCGFSQGGFLATHIALYSALDVICSISFSGGIVPQPIPIKETAKIHLIHGDQDQIILPDWYEKSMAFAAENEKIEISGNMIPGMGHEISYEAMKYAYEVLDRF